MTAVLVRHKLACAWIFPSLFTTQCVAGYAPSVTRKDKYRKTTNISSKPPLHTAYWGNAVSRRKTQNEGAWLLVVMRTAQNMDDIGINAELKYLSTDIQP